MVSLETQKYIKQQAKKRKIDVPINYLNILNSYMFIIDKYGYNLKFKQSFHYKKNSLNASVNIRKNNKNIFVSPRWAADLVLINTFDVHNAFLFILGHEFTHKEINLNFNNLFNIKFYNWVNEVHCDFGAVPKILHNNRQTFVNAINYILINSNDPNKDCLTHPSWERRLYYANHYNFDETLIRKIAEDTKYKNEKNIQKVIQYFETIILK